MGSNKSSVDGDARLWQRRLSSFRQQNNSRAILEIALTVIPLLALWTTAVWAASVHLIAAVLLALPTALFLVRLFMLQHDCGHGSLFSSRHLNDIVGRIMGVFTLTPYENWRRAHNYHHAGAGNLDRRGIGDVTTLTTSEYLGLEQWGRLKYRLYRHPFIMLGLGPVFLFVVQHRCPATSELGSQAAWVSVMGTNAGILLVMGSLVAALGPVPVLIVHLPVVLIAATIGVFLFYVQHQFETTYWDSSATWAPETAALFGSSYLVLPQPFRWLTANIGLHHVHHLSSRIPFYRLPQVLDGWPELEMKARKLTLRDSIYSLKLTLWDESSQRLVSFRELHHKLELLSREAVQLEFRP